MFTRLPDDPRAPVAFHFNGEAMSAKAGDTVAAALLCNGVTAFRTTAVNGVLRGPFCMMGTCFDCLVEIDGEQNRQACQTLLIEGMQVRMQDGGNEVMR